MPDRTGILRIAPGLSIRISELEFQYSRSSGPGGQHVNKVSSKVTLSFDILRSPSLSNEQRRRLITRLKNQIGSTGILRISEQGSRSQWQNRMRVIERFRQMVVASLREPKKRVATKPSGAAVEERLRVKKLRAKRKRQRKPGIEG